jgi:hypothetical protein
MLENSNNSFEKMHRMKKIQKLEKDPEVWYRMNSSKVVLLNISTQFNIRCLPDKKYFFWKIVNDKKQIMHDNPTTYT